MFEVSFEGKFALILICEAYKDFKPCNSNIRGERSDSNIRGERSESNIRGERCNSNIVGEKRQEPYDDNHKTVRITYPNQLVTAKNSSR